MFTTLALSIHLLSWSTTLSYLYLTRRQKSIILPVAVAGYFHNYTNIGGKCAIAGIQAMSDQAIYGSSSLDVVRSPPHHCLTN